MFLDSIGMGTRAATIFVLRRRQQGDEQTAYRLRLYPWIPLLFIASYLYYRSERRPRGFGGSEPRNRHLRALCAHRAGSARQTSWATLR